MKSEFRLLEYTTEDVEVKYAVGSVTYGIWKVEIVINKYDMEPQTFNKGDFIEITGHVKTKSDY